MAPGETGELYEELSGEKRDHPWRCQCGAEVAAQAYHSCDKAEPERVTTHSNTFDGTGSTGGWFPSYIYCTKCNQMYPFGTEHECPEYFPDGTWTPPDPYASGYTCPFCQTWVSYSETHYCLFKTPEQYGEIITRLEEMEQGQEKMLKNQEKILAGLLAIYRKLKDKDVKCTCGKPARPVYLNCGCNDG